MVEARGENGYQELQKDFAGEIKSVTSVTSQIFLSRSTCLKLQHKSSDYSDLLSQESLVPAVSLAPDSNPEFNIEQQQALADDTALVSDDPALWSESFHEQERLDLIKKGLTQIKKFDTSAD
ncbi:MAG: hypothetical protein LBB21_04060 [Holosporaceae bacterium]|nr:hypothetical protein [Holosporaceae bacterium]